MKPEIAAIIPPILGLGNDWTPFEKEVEDRFLCHEPESYSLPVSVVIPVYNRIEKLGKTIAALTHQTYPHSLIEVVIADDGSSDEPESLIAMFEEFFPLKHIFQEDKGYRLSEIRNKGVAAATHDNIIILDCDMLPEPTLVEAFMQYAHVGTRCVMIGGRRYVNTDHLSISDVRKDITAVLSLPSLRTDTGEIPKGDEAPSEDWRYKIYRSSDNLKTEKYPFRAFCGGNVCFHKSLLEVVGPFDETFTAWGAEDTEFGYRVYNHGYWFIPVEKAGALHQEPPDGSNETDREAGKAITKPILIERCPAVYRKMEKDRVYFVPKVSVYMPAYNCFNYVEEAIDSALNQTYTDLEVVVVNDGSTDGTGELLEKIYGNNPRVQIIHQENGGISAASNTALNHCKGEYVLQLDSDDAILPNTVEILTKVLEQNEVGFVYGDSYLTDESSRAYGRAYSWSVFDRKKLLTGMMLHHPRMFRMRDYRRTTGFDESLSNAVDYDIFLKLSEVTDGYHLQTPLYLYRQHKANTSVVNTGTQDTNTHRTIQMAFARIGLGERIELRPEPEHARRMSMTLVADCEMKLDVSAAYQRMGIGNPIKSHHYLWQIGEKIVQNSLIRQKEMTTTGERFVRIGPFGSPRVAISVSASVEHDHKMPSEILTTRQAKRVMYYVDLSAPRNDQAAIELRRHLQEDRGWISEIITKSKIGRVRARNEDTRKVLRAYEDSLTEVITVADVEENIANDSRKYEIDKYWSQEGTRLLFKWEEEEVFFIMPDNWYLAETHDDLLRLAHYVMVAPWDKTVLDGWTPTRSPGWRPGLAFSGGVDSAAAMELMPSSTVLIYNERDGIGGQLNHTNAFRFFEHIREITGRNVIRVPSNHESLRMRDGKMPGFSTDYACGVQVILLADYFGLDSLGTGMPLENSFLWHGYRYRDFEESWFWNHYAPLFKSVGLSLYQPVAGCSEIINLKITNDTGWEGWAQSCLRSTEPGGICGRCWKCFRKNSLQGLPWEYAGEIESFLKKRPLKQGASTLYSIQRNSISAEGIDIIKTYPDLEPMLSIDLEFLNRNHPIATKMLPSRYRTFTELRLLEYCEPMIDSDLNDLSEFDISVADEETIPV